jgi:hypothetical protein
LSGLFTAILTMVRLRITEQVRMAMMIQGQRCLYQGVEAVAMLMMTLSALLRADESAARFYLRIGVVRIPEDEGDFVGGRGQLFGRA